MTDEFPAESVSIWWRHHVSLLNQLTLYISIFIYSIVNHVLTAITVSKLELFNSFAIFVPADITYPEGYYDMCRAIHIFGNSDRYITL